MQHSKSCMCYLQNIVMCDYKESVTTRHTHVDRMDIPYISSKKSPKEGDLPLCILPKREILRETLP